MSSKLSRSVLAVVAGGALSVVALGCSSGSRPPPARADVDEIAQPAAQSGAAMLVHDAVELTGDRGQLAGGEDCVLPDQAGYETQGCCIGDPADAC